jgi:hypothetical protein
MASIELAVFLVTTTISLGVAAAIILTWGDRS